MRTATTDLDGARPLTGVVGQQWRAAVTPYGSIEPLDGSSPLNWYVAAEDRWHDPARASSVRQHRLAGTPVFETRLRVPNGDVVERVWSVADHGGLTLVELANESPRAVAFAVDRPDVLTSRPRSSAPVEGIDVAAGSFVLPVAHGTSTMVAIAHRRRGVALGGAIPASVAAAGEVVNGWLAQTGRASRFELPDPALAEAVTAARCQALLKGVADDVDPAAAALTLIELVRMGEDAGAAVPELVTHVEAVARDGRWDAQVAIERSIIVLAAAEERRALADVQRLLARRGSELAPRPGSPPSGVGVVAWVETLLARGAELMPEGIPPAWRGQHLEVHGVPGEAGSAVSYAVRWHGEHPAVLWEQHGRPVTLRASAVDPSWSSSERNGDAMWRIGGRLGP